MAMAAHAHQRALNTAGHGGDHRGGIRLDCDPVGTRSYRPALADLGQVGPKVDHLGFVCCHSEDLYVCTEGGRDVMCDGEGSLGQCRSIERHDHVLDRQRAGIVGVLRFYRHVLPRAVAELPGALTVPGCSRVRSPTRAKGHFALPPGRVLPEGTRDLWPCRAGLKPLGRGTWWVHAPRDPTWEVRR
jgi:hypothetical protein